MLQFSEPQIQNIISVTISGKVTKEDIERIVQQVKETRKRYDKVRIYLEIPHFEGYTLQGFFDDLKRSMEYINDFEKAAVVTNQEWIGKVGKLMEIFTKADIKSFSLDEKELARQWLVQ